VEVLKGELLLLTPSELFVLWLSLSPSELLELRLLPLLALSEHLWHLERRHLRSLELWHSVFHLLNLLLSGFLEFGLVCVNFLSELFSSHMFKLLWVPSLIETVEHDTGGGEILNNVGDLLDSLLISGALVVVHGNFEEFVANTDEIESVFLDSIPNLTVSPEAGVEVIKAPVLPDIADLLHLAGFVVLVDTVDEHVSGGLHLIGGDLIFVFMELLAKVPEVLPDWLSPITEALFRDWIVLLVVHTSNGLNVRLLHDLSDDLVVSEDILFWDLAVTRLVEDVVMMMAVVVFSMLVEHVGDPAGINSSEEGKKSKLVHLNFKY